MGMDVRPASVLAGVSAAFLVRVPLFKPKARLWAEISSTALGMSGAFWTIVDHNLAPGTAFWCGIVFGAGASSLLEIGKAMAASVWRERLTAALRILANGKPVE
jgi:hypothetical protein